MMQHSSRVLREFGRQCRQLARDDVETVGEHRFFVGLLSGAAFSAVFWGGVALWVLA